MAARGRFGTARRFPRSAKIATVQARVHGDLAAKRAALSLDRDYLPARVMVAKALLERGEPKGAIERSLGLA